MKTRTVSYFGVCLFAIAFLLSSCGPSYQERRDEIENSMKFWVGKSETQLVAKLGPPSNVYKLTDGSKELTYRYVSRPYYGPYYGSGYPYRTERGFTVDPSGTIIAYRWDGF